MVQDVRRPGEIFDIWAPHGPANLEFLDAAFKAEFDDEREPLIRYLSEELIGKPEQYAWVQILKRDKQKNGRPVNIAIFASESVASSFYSCWLRTNKERGIKDYGS